MATIQSSIVPNATIWLINWSYSLTDAAADGGGGGGGGVGRVSRVDRTGNDVLRIDLRLRFASHSLQIVSIRTS